MHTRVDKEILIQALEIAAKKYKFEIKDLLDETLKKIPNKRDTRNLRLYRAERLANALFLNWVGLIAWQNLAPVDLKAERVPEHQVGGFDKAAYLSVKVNTEYRINVTAHELVLYRSVLKKHLTPEMAAKLRKLWKFEKEPHYVSIVLFDKQPNGFYSLKRNYNYVSKEILDFFLLLLSHSSYQS